jgi:TonB family protein
MTKQVLLLLFLSACYSQVLAQSSTDSSAKKYRLEPEFKTVPGKRQVKRQDPSYEIKDYYKSGQLARHETGSSYKDSGSPNKNQGRILEYHLNGNLKEEYLFNDFDNTHTRTEYFSNGKVYKKTHKEDALEKVDEVWSWEGLPLVINGYGRSREYEKVHKAIEEGIYKNGLKDSIWTGCNESRSVCYIERYKKGKLVKGTSRDEQGNTLNYNQISENGEYERGNEEFTKFIKENIEYPKEAMSTRTSGKIFVRFFVEKDGRLTNVEVLRGLGPLFDNEAIRVIKLTEGHWIPSKNRGIPVRGIFTIPIEFINN